MQRARRSIYLCLVAGLVSCSVFEPPANPLGLGDVPQFSFPSTNFWNTKISANAETDPASDIMIAKMKKDKPAFSPWGIPSVAVYYTSSSTPRYNVPVNAVPEPKAGIKSVPIPDYALPYEESDSSIVLIDQNGAIFDLAGNGLTGYIGSRASGFSLLGGPIWPEELLSTNINHALVISWLYMKKGGPVDPATYSDGWSDDPGAIPMGARIQLDPTLDLSSLKIDKYQRAIFRALQEYGAYIADTGGFNIMLIERRTYAQNPYRDIPCYNSKYNSIDLSPLPIEKIRVLKLGPQLPKVNGYSHPELYY
jgi:hypothetical protein